MSIDVLRYNALNAINKPIVANLVGNINTLNDDIATQNGLCLSAQDDIINNKPLLANHAGPNQANLWCVIPELPATGDSWVNGFKVCDTSADFRCGANCTWTVPTGVTCARFQIWGAGAGRGFGCCCAFVPFGGTGSYASVIIPVTADDTYTLCAGCAFCCYAVAGMNNVNGQPGCQSFVTGTNLSNFCADGGESSLFCELQTRCVSGAIAGACVFLGGCICSNASVCWSVTTPGVGGPACCYDNMFPMISSCKTYFGSATGGTVYGIRGSFGSIAVNCNGSICVQHPPIYGFASTSCCVAQLTTNTVGGCCRSASAGFLLVPGAGAWAQFRCAGGTAGASDAGRMGMVCVSFL
jgi:hypothetical protein